MKDLQPLSISAAARAFVLVALLVPVSQGRGSAAAYALVVAGLAWLLASLAERRSERSSLPLLVVEALAVGVAAGYGLPGTIAILGTLAVPPFVAGLSRGFAGTGVALSVELAALLAAVELVHDGASGEQAFSIVTWTITGLGLGLIATFLRSSIARTNDPLEPYRFAQELLRQLIDLSGGFSSGLDPNALGGAILSGVRDEIPTSTLVLYVPRGDGLTPLLTRSLEGEDLGDSELRAERSWAGAAILVEGRSFAFPLSTGAGVAGIVAGTLSERLDPVPLDLRDRLVGLARGLGPSAVHLDTALLFASFRDAATADERRRLSREMHDGVAQEIASLGYVVDALAARPADPQQAERIEMLRERISAIVADVRRSVINLRTTVGESESLGAAIGAIARNLSEVSGLAIEVTLDEHTGRLRPEVEAELFRITQEAVNNAVKHARCTTVRVHCQVHPPRASISVVDDGRGLGEPRTDSFGLGIMRERARLVGADLTVDDLPGGGVSVRVSLGDRPAPQDSSQPSGPAADTEPVSTTTVRA